MSDFKTLTELLVQRKDENEKGIIFVKDRSTEIKVTYAELYNISLRLLYSLQEWGFEKGDEVMFQLDNNEQFIFSFWACTLGGMLPVPITTGITDENLNKVIKISKILNHPRLITCGDYLEKFKDWADKNEKKAEFAFIKENSFVFPNIIQSEKSGKIQKTEETDLAFIQFSSGSTGEPKGVMITHKNVIVNLTAVMNFSKLDKSDVSISWMPLTHDMGLIGDHIKNVLIDIDQVNMQTSLFIKDPVLWFEKVNEHRASILYSPNFGYKHFMESFDTKKDWGWDLSCIKIIYNGAEPISLEKTRQFIDEMGKYKMIPAAMAPVYGLAESTIAVSFPHPGDEIMFHTVERSHLAIGNEVIDVKKGSKNAATFMDVGYAIFNCNLRITDENNVDLGENKIGYIQISGENVTRGYYKNEAATKAAFTDDGWFSTRDLGFLRNGRLTITGRAKDVIFVSGQNFYAQDIERVAESAVQDNSVKIAAAGIFSEERGTDELILFTEYEGDIKDFIETAKTLRLAVSEKLSVETAEIVPIKAFPKTVSGKVQYFKLVESYTNGEFNEVLKEIHSFINKETVKETPKNETEQKLSELWSQVIKKKFIGVHENFFYIGGDSLKIIQLLSRINNAFGVTLEQSELYENPDIASMAKLIDNSQKAENKAAIIEKQTIKSDKYPLSFSQQSLWFLNSINNKSPEYNLHTTLKLKGKVDEAALEKSLNAVIARHSPLRMSFYEENGVAFAKIADDVLLNLEVINLFNSGEAKEKIIKSVISKPFNFEKAPLIRATLIKTGENESTLVLAVHHIVFDGWSFTVLMKELGFFYKKFTQNSGETLPQTNIDYTDYVAWQNNQFESGIYEKELSYWKNTLNNLPVLDLPSDRQRPSVQSYKGAMLRNEVSSDVLKGLKDVSVKNNVTLFMVLLASFNILLSRYSGKTDITVGTPTANRTAAETEDLIGLFTNNLVLRTKFNESDTLEDLLKKVKAVTLDAYKNQNVPFEKVVEAINNERDMSKNPLFQVFFALQNTPEANMKLGNLTAERRDVNGETSKFDISLDITEKVGKLELALEYSTDLFDKETIESFCEHYKKILELISKKSICKVNELDIIATEENSLFSAVNNTKRDYDYLRPWTALFEEKAKLTPNNIAVECGEKRLTYSELNAASNKLANYLMSLGVKKETVVGVYLDRKIEMLIALIAVHKVGAAYLPMDPIFPKERLKYMLCDAEVDVVISEEMISQTLPETKAKKLLLGKESEIISGFSDENPNVRKTADSLAYLIYTSGSTGKPKGVMIEHHSLVNLLCSFKEQTGIKPSDSLLAVTTLSFDIAGLELYLPLISGAKVVIAPRDEVVDGESLIKEIEDNNITFMQATPATWRLLLEAGFSGEHNLTVLCGGEAFPKSLAEKLSRCCKRVLNVYGPTETTIWSTFDEITENSKIMIGKPLANTSVYILDDSLNRVPVGVEGELYIGGDGLARGYRNLEALTAEKFIHNPYSSDDEKIYKTGDLVKMHRDGRIEFLSRRDNQIKIRGYRIELGEIETLIASMKNVKQCVVTDKEIHKGEKSLVAYLVTTSPVDISSLRAKLREKLPSYMVPELFITVKVLPLTPNGKIDKKALPMPQKAEQKKAIVGNFNDVEKTVTEIWKEVLELEDIDPDASFFDVGGHSLLLAKVRSGIQKAFSRDIPMLELFKYPTIKSITRYLTNNNMQSKNTLQQANKEKTSDSEKNDIAVIGMSARFPGASNIDEFWKNLCDGKDTISRFTDKETLDNGVAPETLNKKNYVKAWGDIDDVYKFDAEFFGYNPTEATVIDPQQRIFLEEAWKALEDAAYDTKRCNDKIAVFASVGRNNYVQNLKNSYKNKGLSGDYQIMTGNEKDFIATRTAYKLGLKGPAATVQTACSSSMTALHLACESLKKGECDMALAGGVSIKLPQKQGYLYEEGMILSPDGYCRAFDSKSKGTVGGNGAGVVVLKRLEDAIRDGDVISAVIKGTAVNNDGSDKIGFTAPSVTGEAGAIKKAQIEANVNPETITFVETHGTGTPLGDPIEIEALSKVFGEKTVKKNFCAIGSVKTNIGHLDAASGIAGFIKTVLSLRNKKIPASLHFESPNPKIDFKNSAFYVNTETKDWNTESLPRRAGISSFGIGGTNVHAVLEEAPIRKPDNANIRNCLLVLSARNQNALSKMAENLKMFFEANPETDIVDAAYTLQVGRREFKYRRFIIAASLSEAAKSLIDKEKFSENNGVIANGDKKISNPLELSLEEVGKAWLSGALVDFERLYNTLKMNRVSLPTYPFEGNIYRADENKVSEENVKSETNGTKVSDIDKWFYSPLLKESASFAKKAENDDFYTLLFLNKGGAAEKIAVEFKNEGLNTKEVFCEENAEFKADESFTIDPENFEHYEKVFQYISEKTQSPLRIINLLGVTGDKGFNFEGGMRFYMSLINTAKAIGKTLAQRKVLIKTVTDGALKLFNETKVYPEKSLCLGAIRVIPIEYKNISCGMIDLDLDGEIELSDVIDELYSENTEETAFRFNGKYLFKYANETLPVKTNRSAKLKNGGTYLITGGLGGLGLMLAGEIAKETKGNLVLVSRSKFPDENLWEEYLLTHENDDPTAIKIKTLKVYKNLGANILTYSADVTDIDSMQRLREEILAKYGTLDGIILAAGAAGGGMIQQKTRDIAKRAFSAKVKGTLTVYRAFSQCNPNFIIMCSSLNAVTGGFGQSDYSAANAFLDSFAKAYDSKKTRIISIDWDRFPGIGIAKSKKQNKVLVNAILGKLVSKDEEKSVYLNTISPEKYWILSEHEVLSVPTVAGTTYLEMARAAFEDLTEKTDPEIFDVVFLNPMAVKYGETRKVFTILTKKDGFYEFAVISDDGEKKGYVEHALGKIKAISGKKTDNRDIGSLQKSCGENVIFNKEEGSEISERFIKFGRRWRSLQQFTVSKTEGLAHVKMDDEFQKDIDSNIKLHPSVLDVAAGSLRLAASGDYLPFSYKSIKIFTKLPREIYSHLIFNNKIQSGGEVLSCNIEILSPSGELISKITGFSMKKLSAEKEENLSSKHEGANQKYAFLGDLSNDTKGFFQEGITKDEGIEAFKKILHGCAKSQIIVSVRDIESAFKKANYLKENKTLKELSAAETREHHPRPELDSAYAPPVGETQAKLCVLWQDILGIDKVGIYDDFFALGGDSLLLIQFHSKLKECFETEIAIVDLYKFNTIATLSKQLDKVEEKEAETNFEAVTNRAEIKRELLKKRKMQRMKRG